MESPLHKIATELAHINRQLLDKWPTKDLLPDTKAEMVLFYKHWQHLDNIVYDIRQFPLMYKDALIADAKELIAQTSIYLAISRRDAKDWEESIHFEKFSEEIVLEYDDYVEIMSDKGYLSSLFSMLLNGFEGTDKRAEWQTLCRIADNISQFELIYMEMLVSQLYDLATGTIISIPKTSAL